MMTTPKKPIRKLVTLPPDLADRVEKFREYSNASSESDALKTLIEDGLKLRDRPEDLFRRCETSTAAGQSLGEIINLVTSDHPLVERTVLDNEALIVDLKTPADAASERFRFSRAQKTWFWEVSRGDYDDAWTAVEPLQPDSSKRASVLDDDIPF